MKININKLSHIKDYLPLILSIIIFLALVSTILVISAEENEGNLVYALDDPYIHMAMAKNFALHGVWGVTKYGFTSSSSSPLYTLLLSAIYFIFGVSVAVPFILNIIFAIILLAMVYHILNRYKITSFYSLFILLSLVIFTPLPALVFVGMEHILQIILFILFIYLAAKLISIGENQKEILRSYEIYLLILAPLVTTVRYEGLVLLAVVCALFFIYKRFLYSIIIGLVGIIPVVIYGLISMSKGWYFIPNSILIKENANILPYFLTHHQINLLPVEIQFLELLCAYLVFIFTYTVFTHYMLKKEIKKEILVMNIILIALGIINFLFAGVGWFYRYDAYLVALGILVISLSLAQLKNLKSHLTLRPDKNQIHQYITFGALSIIIIALIISPLESRGFESLKETPQSTNDRYLGHIYPAKFIAEYYNNSTVVVNDLGAVSFYTDAHILDMYGLGSKEPVYFLLEKKKYNKSEVKYWSEQESAEIAILQPEWIAISPRIPDSWMMVGKWNTPQNVAFGDTTIGFYALNPSKKDDLIKNLRNFSSNVPGSIRQSGEYTKY